MAYFSQLNMNGSDMCCLQVGSIKATLSFPSVMRPAEAASPVRSQNEKTME